MPGCVGAYVHDFSLVIISRVVHVALAVKKHGGIVIAPNAKQNVIFNISAITISSVHIRLYGTKPNSLVDDVIVA